MEQLQLLRQAAQARRQEAQERRQRLGAEALRKQLAAVEAQHAAEQAIKDAQLAQHKAKAEEVVNFGEKKLIGGSWELGGGRWMDFWKFFFLFEHMLFLCDFVGIPGMFLDAVSQNHINPAHKKQLYHPGNRWKKWPNAWCFVTWA